MKNKFAYISIHGPVVILKLVEVMLRRALYLVDLQQQLVVVWFVDSWSKKKVRDQTLKQSQICAGQENKDAMKQRSHGRLTHTQSDSLIEKQVDWQTYKRRPSRGILNYCTFHHHTCHITAGKKWHLPFSYRRHLSISATVDSLLFTMTRSCEGNITFAQRSPGLPHLRKTFHGQGCDMWKWEVTDSPSLLSTVSW